MPNSSTKFQGVCTRFKGVAWFEETRLTRGWGRGPNRPKGLAPFSNLNFFVKNRQNFFAIEKLNFRFFSFSASKLKKSAAGRVDGAQARLHAREVRLRHEVRFVQEHAVREGDLRRRTFPAGTSGRGAGLWTVKGQRR